MSKDRSLVRASDIGAWTYCHRAWWLAEVKDTPHGDPLLLQQGNVTHVTHGRQVAAAYRLRQIGLLLIALGLILVCLLAAAWLFSGS
jgi:hypothetical protein